MASSFGLYSYRQLDGLFHPGESVYNGDAGQYLIDDIKVTKPCSVCPSR
ncbi:hypothetical protein [Methyloglobulus sp.]